MRVLAVSILAATAAVGASAHAQVEGGPAPAPLGMGGAAQNGFYAHVGPGALLFKASAVVREQGAVIPGGTIDIDPNVTLITEIGYRRERIGVSLTGGYPPLATVDGAGLLTPLGALGRIRYGPTVLTVHYTFWELGRLQSYVGAGPVFLLVFKNQDGAIRHLDVHDSVGGALQLGAELGLTDRCSAFLDVKKAILRTAATAQLGGAPIKADIHLDPLVLTLGASFRF